MLGRGSTVIDLAAKVLSWSPVRSALHPVPVKSIVEGIFQMSSESSNGKADAMPVRRREMAKWRRQRILDAALAVFGSKGVDGASMKEVAAAAGVAPGLRITTSRQRGTVAGGDRRARVLPELRELLSRAKQRPAAIVLPKWRPNSTEC